MTSIQKRFLWHPTNAFGSYIDFISFEMSFFGRYFFLFMIKSLCGPLKFISNGNLWLLFLFNFFLSYLFVSNAFLLLFLWIRIYCGACKRDIYDIWVEKMRFVLFMRFTTVVCLQHFCSGRRFFFNVTIFRQMGVQSTTKYGSRWKTKQTQSIQRNYALLFFFIKVKTQENGNGFIVKWNASVASDTLLCIVIKLLRQKKLNHKRNCKNAIIDSKRKKN